MPLTQADQETLATFVGAVLNMICDHPTDAKGDYISGKGTTVVVEIAPHQSDVGLMIGRGGRNAQAIRNLIGSFGRSKGQYIHTHIIDTNTMDEFVS